MGWEGTNHDQLAADVFDAVEAVVVLAFAERVRVDVGGEVAHGCFYAFVECSAEGEVAAETHSCGALLCFLVSGGTDYECSMLLRFVL